uniref:EF-hand domain-containing protein n=1 Tax=Rhabditophanes sp. KR3021 TaxID=114890 RepID=A0AC35U3H1_9BILA
MTHLFDEIEIEKFRECFNLYVKTGFVTSHAQLRFLMRSLGYCPTVEETKLYFKTNYSQVDFPTFLQIIHEDKQKYNPIQEISNALQALRSFDGTSVSVSEFGCLLHKFGEQLSSEEIDGAIKAMAIKGQTIPHSTILKHLSS